MNKITTYASIAFLINAFFPDNSYADGISPMLNLFSPETIYPAIVITAIIILFEACLLNWRIREIAFREHLSRSLIINIASSATGSLIVWAASLTHYFVWESFSLILPLYLITLITETPVLKALYKEVNITWPRAIKLSIGINTASYFVVLLLEFGLLFLIFSGAIIGPITVKGAAEALVVQHDFQDYRLIMKKANQYGDHVLEPLKEYSKDFTLLNYRNAVRIATVLGENKSPKSEQILNDLWTRENPYAKLVAAIGLGLHQKFPDKLKSDSFILININAWLTHENNKPKCDPEKCPEQYMKWLGDDLELQEKTDLSIIALGYSRDDKALPTLLAFLKMQVGYGIQAHACEACARIASSDAIPVLEDCLKSSKFNALPEAFRALISLNDKQALPLAIARVTPDIKAYNSGRIVDELTKVTGKDFGYDRDRWQSWWQSNGQSWTVPAEFRKPYDEQRKLY
jgi:hypothetical protein